MSIAMNEQPKHRPTLTRRPSIPFTSFDATCSHRIRLVLANGRSRCARFGRAIETTDAPLADTPP